MSLHVKQTKNQELEFRKACMEGNVATVNHFIGTGGNVNSLASAFDMSALHIASKNGHTEIVKVLLMNGANINAKNRFDQTPLHLAILSGHLTTVSVLIEGNANLNLKNKAGTTPLHLCCRDGKADIAKLLLQKGADTTIQDQNGRTALKLAENNNHFDIVKLFPNGEVKGPSMPSMSGANSEQNATAISPPSANSTRAEETVDSECRICLTEPSTMVFFPCGHICVCEGCAKAFKECPICRGHILHCIKFYRS